MTHICPQRVETSICQSKINVYTINTETLYFQYRKKYCFNKTFASICSDRKCLLKIGWATVILTWDKFRSNSNFTLNKH